MAKKAKGALTRDKIIGMQVIDSDGFILGNVKELSMVIGELDQALLVADAEGNDTEVRWSEIAAVGDIILLKPKKGDKAADKSTPTAYHCPSCGTELESGALFCPNCGNKISR